MATKNYPTNNTPAANPSQQHSGRASPQRATRGPSGSGKSPPAKPSAGGVTRGAGGTRK